MRVEERGEPRDVVVAVLEERVVRPARELVDADVGDLSHGSTHGSVTKSCSPRSTYVGHRTAEDVFASRPRIAAVPRQASPARA